MKKIIIIGATSGIGRELARIYAGEGHLVGVTGRRHDLLYSLQLEFPNYIVTECFDVTSPQSIAHLQSLIEKMEGLDMLIYNAGYGDVSDVLDWKIDRETVDVNVNGFIAITHYAFQYFVLHGGGQLATTSSIASIRGNSHAPAYSASKAFQSIYFEGLYMKAKKAGWPVHVSDIQPGFVNTKMAKAEKRFWVSSPEKAARQIAEALRKRKWRAYITRRWWLVAKLAKWMPGSVYHRIG